MSRPLDLNRTMALLAELRTALTEFIAKERALTQADQTKRHTAAKASEFAAKQRATALAERLASLDNDFAAAQEQVERRFDRREARIRQAHKTVLKRAKEQIDQAEGREKYLFQKRTLDAERRHQSETAQAAAALQQTQNAVQSSQERFATLEYSARDAFSFSSEFRKLLAAERAWPAAEDAGDEAQILQQLDTLHGQTGQALRSFRRNPVIGIFRMLPVWLLIGTIVLAYLAVMFVLPLSGVRPLAPKDAAVAAAAALVLIALTYQLGKRLVRSKALLIAGNLAKAHQWHEAALRQAEARRVQDDERSQQAWEVTSHQLHDQWDQAFRHAEEQRAKQPAQLDQKKDRLLTSNEQWYRRSVDQLEQDHRLAGHQLKSGGLETGGERVDLWESLRGLDQTLTAEQRQLEEDWQARVVPLWAQIEAANLYGRDRFPDWAQAGIQLPGVGARFEQALKFGTIEVDLEKLAGDSLAGSRLQFPGPKRFTLPLLLTFPADGTLLLETAETGAPQAAAALNALVFQVLASITPGKAAITLIDPMGLGQTFAGLMHLADYEESPIQGRVWTQAAQIEERLGELNEHMEKVIQMYLRNEYATIAEYNEQAGAVAEKYHFLVIAGFPTNFTEAAGRRLLNIVASGARCGIFTFMQWDRRVELPHGFLGDELRKNGVRLSAGPHGFVVPGRTSPGTEIRLDAPPEPAVATEFLREVGEHAKNSTRVELPFAQIAPRETERWSQDSAEEVRVPIGRSGATKLQYLALGQGTRQHALIAGKTGSGKSTLFHVIITNTALWYSPEQVEFYLVDFKKGVEFKVYANRRLPHARVVAIESDREFGLSVLQRLDEELRRRGDLFRRADVQDLAGYRKARPGSPLSRLMLLIDEFQEFFTEEDRISQSAAVLLDRIVRQGRAFGVHVVLGSQTLGGAYTLARATIGQMVVRIALQCNEADAYLIMDESNAAPRLLTRPGEGIYNDMAGALEGNSPFQTAWLSDEARDTYLAEVQAAVGQRPGAAPEPVVFEGNAPADLHDNHQLQTALRQMPAAAPAVPRVWIGAPNSIKGPTEVVFQRQSGANFLIVGQGEEAVVGVPAMALLSLAAQYPVGAVRLILLDSTPPASREREFLDAVVRAIPHPIRRPNRSELPTLVVELATEIQQREQSSDGVTTFLMIVGLQDFKALRQEDEFSFSTSDGGAAPNAAASLLSLITDGPTRGCHVIASIDTYANVTRFLGRKALGEFQARVLFQMSASDSASLIDSPDGGKLGLHRALLYNEREGYLEKFRPYALSGNEWIEEVSGALHGRERGSRP